MTTHLSKTLAAFLLLTGLLLAPPTRAQRPVIRALHDTANPAQDSVFRLGSTITLEVAGLGRWLRAEEASLRQRGVDPAKARAQARNLVLYLDDAPLLHLPPLSVYEDLAATRPGPPADSSSKVIFRLSRNEANTASWNVVYNSPWDFARPSKIGLGYDDRVITDLYPGQGNRRRQVRLEFVRPRALGVGLGVVALLGLGILALGSRSRLLRNNLPADAPAAFLAPSRQLPFSLAKSQLAWWTFLVVGSYLLIYCVTGETTRLTSTTLLLLGISAGTAGVSRLITGVQDATASELELRAVPAAAPAVPAGRGWLTDVLSDNQGVSIHRLQQVLFTVLLGYLFVRTVYKTMTLPDWNDNETLLLTISSATYLGLKWQEKATSIAPPPAAATSTAAVAGPTLRADIRPNPRRTEDFTGPVVVVGAAGAGRVPPPL